MSIACDFCSATLAPIYKPAGSTRGLTVYLCGACGLVQSAPRIARTKDRHAASISGGADWGNVRYGKSFRTADAMAALARHVDLTAPLALLDVGSNRGSFLKVFSDAAPKSRITAVEPDERYADSVAAFPRTRLLRARIEATMMETESFDIVHSCHTIEHLAEPFAALRDHARTLRQGGILIIDAPNIALIGGEDIVEEWFIDKHLFHFSERTLARMIEAAGFDIVERPDARDRVNLLFVARKTGRAPATIAPDPAEVEAARDLFAAYRMTRARNLAALRDAAIALDAMAPRRVAIWGAGRLFDLLVREGGFDPTTLALLIDTHLQEHIAERYGTVLSGPDALSETSVDTVIVMSRMFASEIAQDVKVRAPHAEIVLYGDLLTRARSRKAA